MDVKGKYAVNADVASAVEVARLHHGVTHAMARGLLEVAVEMHLGKSDLILAKRAAAVEGAKRDTRYPVLDVLDAERSTYGNRVPLVVDVVLLPAAKKRLVPCATAKEISSANDAMDVVSHTGRKRVKVLKLQTMEKERRMRQMNRMSIWVAGDVEGGEVNRYKNELNLCSNHEDC